MEVEHERHVDGQVCGQLEQKTVDVALTTTVEVGCVVQVLQGVYTVFVAFTTTVDVEGQFVHSVKMVFVASTTTVDLGLRVGNVFVQP